MRKSYNQRNAKVDSNQPIIVKALRRIGCKVIPTHMLKNAFDILVIFKGNTFIIEIKNSDYLPKIYFNKETEEEKRKRLEGLLSDGERKCMEDIQAKGGEYHIIATIDEALNLVNSK